ncbi:radical SAM protein [Veillonella caviae]|uniref:radical SAM protein n=1 Tax=Veillonella caviae TaxID=248316 RepID=UPI0023F29B04|nr:radical SAM protein [Veillonella caviae]MCI6406987.1 radical SAM protein [Veillonella caviae]MDY6224383.1 radical SAM protein [Veillonella caviae]
MNVIEIFGSIEGEGVRAGELCTFIRLSECNLRCSYCDTTYSFEPGEEMSVDEIVQRVNDIGFKNITITGGEPLLQDIRPLIDALHDYDINIETNGSINPIPMYGNFPNVFFTVDYKGPSSDMEGFMNNGDVLTELSKYDVIKFVVGTIEDLDRMRELITNNDYAAAVYVSPVFGRIEAKDIVEYVKQYKDELKNVRVQLQIHKFIWPPDMKGV